MCRHSKVPESGLWVQGRYAISDSIRFCVAVVVPTCAEASYQKLREERLTGLTCMHAQWFKHFQTSLLSAAMTQQLANADGWAAIVHETHGKRLVVASFGTATCDHTCSIPDPRVASRPTTGVLDRCTVCV